MNWSIPYDERTIPTNGGEGENSRLHSRESRLNLDLRGPAGSRTPQLFFETDFYGSGNTLRLRQAYGRYRGLLAGQTWSTFVDETNIPPTIDFESPVAIAFVRQAQIRWTQPLGNGASLAAAVEEADPEIVQPAGVMGSQEDPFSDLVAHLRCERDRGHVQMSGFLG